ncbi:MAG TPA: enoyl-CoA hydratase-related protein [Terriglobia bacterium]|nr:enoyl-CoA hydratase-related protein [Terriglobia bacterium]
MAYESIALQTIDAVAVLTLNRPEKRNAITHTMIAEILEALDEAEKGSAKVLILTGAANAFCAGMDLQALKDFRSQSDAEIVDDARLIATLFRRLYSFPKPTIAAVNGPAIAGGCGLATVCDFTLAVPEAKFGYTEVRVGFIPALVSSYVIRQVGEKRARDLLLLGRIFSAAEAQSMGIVNELIDLEKLMPRALELARSLAEMSPVALSHTKRLLVNFSEEELDRQTEIAVEASARVRKTEDFHEGLAAFLEKRKPQWRGQ